MASDSDRFDLEILGYMLLFHTPKTPPEHPKNPRLECEEFA